MEIYLLLGLNKKYLDAEMNSFNIKIKYGGYPFFTLGGGRSYKGGAPNRIKFKICKMYTLTIYYIGA